MRQNWTPYTGGNGSGRKSDGNSERKDIFKEMAVASRECDELVEIYYGDEDPLLPDVRRAIQRVQDGLSNCASAFVAYMAIARLTLG
jgi:hypothetical protein